MRDIPKIWIRGFARASNFLSLEKKKSDKPSVIVLIEFVLTCKTSGFIFTDLSVFCGRKFTLGVFQHTPEIFVLNE